MLVKFISFVITIFGTKRYQPAVFASIAVIVSAIGITTIMSTYQAPVDTAASTADHSEDPTTSTLNEQTPATKSLRENPSSTETPTSPPAPTDTSVNDPKTSGSSDSSVVQPVIQLNSDSNLNLKAGQVSELITTSLSDSTVATWTVTSTSTDSLTINHAAAHDGSNSSAKTSFSIKASTPGTYTVTVRAKDTTRGVDVTKNITLTITAS